MKVSFVGLTLFLGLFLNATDLADVRKANMTPMIQCDSTLNCDGKNAKEIRISSFDSEITTIVCKNEKNCEGISAGQARMNGLFPIVICKVNQDCGNIDFRNANFYGVKPVVPCTINGDCDGLTPTQVRMNQLTPVVFLRFKWFL